MAKTTVPTKGLLPTPPLPKGLPKVNLTENAFKVFVRRYVRKGPDGKPVETPEETFWRVAYHVAKAESEFGADEAEIIEQAKVFYKLLIAKRYIPNSPTWTGAGTPLGQLAACFVLPISDDMGRKDSGIFTTLRNAALIQQTGGGNGFSFSRLRPKGTLVKSSAGQATGPVGFLRVYDKAFGEIAQGGSRRGANMAVLRVDHPDIEEFITCKTDENAITNFNISVGITDAFMRAVENDEEWELRFPDVLDPRYDTFDGTLEQAEDAGIPIRVYKKVRARDLFDKIVKQAHHNGEPGLLFLDTANRSNPVPHLYPLEATNPCFVGDVRIATTKGLIPIKELAALGKAFDIVTDKRAPFGGVGQALSGEGTTPRLALRAWKTRTNTPVMRLRTRYGYTVVATPDHPFLTPRGYVALQDLRPGDELLLQSGEGGWSDDNALPNREAFAETRAAMALAGDYASGHQQQRRDFAAQYAHLPQTWSQELGLVLGWLVGDGWMSPASHSPVGMAIQSPAMLERIHRILRPWFGEGHVADRGSHYQLTYGRLPYEFFASLGVEAVKSPHKRVPESIWRAPREAVVGFLQGLFSADGSVQVNAAKSDCTVRLASSSRGLLEDVQLLLLNFGIVARIYQRRKAKATLLPDGHGGQRAYQTAEQYELVIGKANRDRFAHLIGFADPEKQQRLMQYVESLSRGPYRETFVDTVESIEDAGTADVYDLTEPETHSLIANGLVCHNCGEQWLGPYENCCLGSINLAQHTTPEGKVDWDKLRETTELAVRFLDDVVEANAYVPAVPQLKEAAHRARRIGLGIMGLADLMYANGVRYGSPEAQEFAAQVMEFIRYHAMRTSIALAKARGPFPAIKGSIYDPENLKWQPPQWPDWLGSGPKTDWGRPELDWDAIVEGIRQHGIRNAAQTTIAPTGTVSTVSGVEGYGCEPVFALAYIRHVNDNGKDLQLTYTSPLFMKALEDAGLDEETRNRIIEQVLEQGTCQHIPEVPEHIKHTFVVASDITAEEHVYMQAALQAFVDNSISKCVTGDTLVLTAQGLKPIAEFDNLRLPDQFASLSEPIVSPERTEPATAFYYGGMKETRRLTLRYGLTVEGTPNHRIQVLDASGAVAFRRLDEIRPGDLAVVYVGQRKFGPAGAPLPRFSGAFRTNSTRLTFPQHMSTDLAFFLGAVTAEGAIMPNTLNITNRDRRLLERLQAIAQRLFGLSGHIATDQRNGVHYLLLHSRPLRHWLVNDLGLQPGAAHKVIPTCILQAAEEEIAAFLKGLFLDAYMTENGRTFGITLASRRLIQQLQVLLLNMDVVATVRQTAERAWNLTVQGNELEHLAAAIGFVETWKNERIARRNLGRLHRKRNYSRLLPEQVTQALREIQQTGFSVRKGFATGEKREAQAYQRTRVNLLAGHRLSRHDAYRLYQAFRQQGAHHPFADTFFAHDNPHKLYVPVEKIEVGFAEVFDLTVPGSHAFVANGLGNHNTVNFPADATPDDVAKAYTLAWKLGIKGLTVYVTGSREKVVLETKATAKAKGKDVALKLPGATSATEPEQPRLWNEPKKPRPSVLRGWTYRIETPVGRAFVTINENGGNQPFEVFINTAKAGSETAAISEAIGRLISYILRLTSTVEPRERLREVVRQLGGIGGGRSAGFGPNRVRSLPDGIAQAIKRYLDRAPGDNHEAEPEEKHAFTLNLPSLLGNDDHHEHPQVEPVHAARPETPEKRLDITQVGDICPECGAAAVVYTEGCARCYACGYSECK